MNELRRDADTIADSSDDAEHSCDDIRLAWLCAELAPGRVPRAAQRLRGAVGRSLNTPDSSRRGGRRNASAAFSGSQQAREGTATSTAERASLQHPAPHEKVLNRFRTCRN